jgi:DNA invertase Pin-like site-specific DNA recombinase
MVDLETTVNYVALLKEKKHKIENEISEKENEIIEQMKLEGIDNYDSKLCKVSYINGKPQTRLDTNIIKELFTEEQLSSAYKTINVKDSIRITIKKDKA